MKDESQLRVQTECAQAQSLRMEGGRWPGCCLSLEGITWGRGTGWRQKLFHRVEKVSTPRLRITFGQIGIQGTYHSFVHIY